MFVCLLGILFFFFFFFNVFFKGFSYNSDDGPKKCKFRLFLVFNSALLLFWCCCFLFSYLLFYNVPSYTCLYFVLVLVLIIIIVHFATYFTYCRITHTHYFVIHNNNNGLLLGFNAAKNYQLGWYNLQKESYNPVDFFDKKRTFVMNGMTEYNKNEGASKDKLISLRLVNKRNGLDDYYIGKEKVIVVSYFILFVWLVGFFCSVVVVFFHFCLSFLAYYNMQSLLTHICFFTNHTKIKDIIVRLVLIVERMKLEIRLLYYKNQ